jgi:hypothetical protein
MTKKQIFIGVVTVVILAFLVSHIVVERRLSILRESLDLKLSEQKTLLEEVARTTGRGSANKQVLQLIPGCSADDGNKFDELLSSLDRGLNKTELTTLRELFNICGNTPALRRQAMVNQFERELVDYQSLRDEREKLGRFDSNEETQDKWQELLVAEKKIGDLFYQLVTVQSEIINGLLYTSDLSTNEIEMAKAKAVSIKNELNEITLTASGLRLELIP